MQFAHFSASAVSVALFSALAACSAHACTIWAATGDGITQDGHTLAVQVYDYPRLVDVRFKSGFGSGFDIYGGYTPGFAYGVNEKGLFVGNASGPNHLAEGKRPWRSAFGNRKPHEEIARTCDSVDAALKRTDLFDYGYPNYFLLADRQEIAIVECMPDGTHVANRAKRGFRFHTNHYAFKDTLHWSDGINRRSSTYARWRNIRRMLKEAPKPMSFNDFIAFSKDHRDGDVSSIFNGNTQGVIAVDIAPDGKVKLYQRIRKDPLDKQSEWEEKVFDLKF